MTRPDTDDGMVDVVVVGAGFAGLVAATELAGHGLDVRVVDARDRVGGKTESSTDHLGRVIDTGGQFVNDDMHQVLALIRSFGLDLHTVDHGAEGHYRGTAEEPVEAWRHVAAAEEAYARLWHPDVTHDPRSSLAEWLTGYGLDPAQLGAARSSLDGVMCWPIDRLPVGHAVDLARRTPLTRQELQHVVPSTLHGLAVRLAEGLPHAPHLGCPIRAIRTGDDVTVVADGHTWRARHVVLALPPTAVHRLGFTPPLPDATRHALAAFAPGSVYKFVVRYTDDVWHDRPGGSVTMWDDPAGLYVGDASLPGAPMLVAFLGGPACDAWRPLGEAGRRQRLLALLVDAYGPAAGEPVSFVERDWSPDEWGGGGYWNVLVDADHLDAVDVLRRGAAHITFASTELAPSFPGYVEGAITAGRAAAQRVLAARSASATAG